MKNLIQAAVVTLFAASTTHAQQAVQWKVSDGGNGHWYQLSVVGPIGWSGARDAAIARGGHLATCTTEAERNLVREVVVSSGYGESETYRWGPWLGGYQDTNAVDFAEPSSGWMWITGEAWSYEAWRVDEPNNLCSQSSSQENFLSVSGNFAQSNGAWNDLPANGCGGDPVRSYVVEWSADCNQDGIVDYGQILQGQLGDTNTDGIPDVCQPPTCRNADIYRDFNVNGADLGILLSQWGPNTPLTESDLNNDGVVNGADLGLLLSFWGACP
jgi:hypothetical protein